jgi:hypothetical protein
MPLVEGSTNSVISKNMRELVKSGYSKKQAAAIAYSQAGRGRRKRKKNA